LKIKKQLFLVYEKAKLWFYAIVVIAFVSACANQVAPSGGPKDTEAPKLVSSFPPSESTNFRNKTIKIKFNEYLENSAFTRTLISPPTAKAPKIRVNLKTIHITLPEDLDSNTTYIINFADDIKDINESNSLTNFAYVFSTGDKIDTQKVSGKVVDAFSGEPIEGALVLLQPADSLNRIKHAKPKYFAITDNSGKYAIKNIKPNYYAIAALKDLNLNFIYDQVSEKIGFKNENINLLDSAELMETLEMFEQIDTKIKVEEAEEIEPGKIQVVFSAPVEKVEIDGKLAEKNTVAFFNEKKDTLTLWHEKMEEKESILYFSLNDTLKDTARIKLQPILIDTVKRNNKNSLIIDFQEVKKQTGKHITKSFHVLSMFEPLKIFFSRPVEGINDSVEAIILTNDTTEENTIPKISIDKKTKLFAEVDFKKEESSFYTLTIPPRKFLDILGFVNDSVQLKFQTNNIENYATLKLKIFNASANYKIVEVISAKDKKLMERFFILGNEKKMVTLKGLAEGSYEIRVIDDVNKNGVWDTGNFDLRTQPEKVTIFNNLPQLKGGWEGEFDLPLE